MAVNWSLRSSLLGFGLLSPVHPGRPSPDYSGFFEAELTLVAIHGLADDHMIEELDLKNPGGFINPAGQPEISLTRVRVARGMIMEAARIEDH